MWTFIKILVWLAIAIVGLRAIDKLLLWAEGRGWIFYRRNKPTPGALGNAFLEIHGLIEQGKRVIVQEMKKAKHDESYSGDPVNPDGFDEHSTKDK
jgi:hypothetical protein